ncbi:sugar ABC transporter permease [Streptomyces sp. WAC05374]|uniref:carbohydrate ABC transporter permease n=1 Tax=Streptomyces sp. WAC05374 TaxID=2487420 RepID=UPI000F899870|nr:sugar ABC transporter permease [Streptomyces sp. WAC05374]RST19364.1 sugar ABC transporter permease [Streptomyces sp. WAC05374]TDF47642.1 sugar ABC transporter permease [Streptomyces sp. WAC05374]TDF48650.1 sugar ABC transporter permease [Streptomyces sp. WAC05374]TDF59100.1 sugar ABC transporter permease [Streptomyces sp. WAC05374]
MAVETSQSVAKAAGAHSARGRGRRTDNTPGSPGPGRLRRALSTHWYAWSMVAPVVTVIGVIIGYPLARGIYLSLTDANEANVERTIGVNHIPATYEFVGLDNYKAVLTDEVFWDRLGWTVVWTVSCVALSFTLGLVLANMLNRRIRGRAFYRMALILPWAVPAFVSVFTWRLLFNERSGLFNKLLAGGGIDAISWLNDPTWAKISVIAVNVWLGVPFMLVAMLGGLQSIPGELYEAAEMDGATAWQRFRHITLPGLRPVSGTVILLSSIWTFNMFPVIFLLTRGGPGDATEILVTYAYRLSFVVSPRDFAGSAAWGVLILILLSLFAVVYRRALRKQGDMW